MKELYLDTKNIAEWKSTVSCGDKIYLSGTVYTARDAAHKRIFELLDNNKPLPFEIKDSVIYYAGPTPTPNGLAIGSCGPTTSARMDAFAPALYNLGMACSIGKGPRSQSVVDAMKNNKSVYLCALGGAGALASISITECHVLDFEDLGCESVKKLVFDRFPLFVGIDANGNSLF